MSSLEHHYAGDRKWNSYAEDYLDDNARLLAKNIGKSGERRKLVLTKFPFIIIYALKRKINEVHILRILHTSRKLSAKYQTQQKS